MAGKRFGILPNNADFRAPANLPAGKGGKMPKRLVRQCHQGILNHLYQRARNGFLIFYSISDYLVFFTVFCTEAQKHNVRVLTLCQMPDHIHSSLYAGSRKELSAFVSAYSCRFVRMYRQYAHFEGPLFDTPYGSVPKTGAKKARANILYVGNNPPERQLCTHAEEYRWNYIAYGKSTHPFSKELVLRRSSWPLQRAVREVKAQHAAGKPLPYAMLQRLFKPLDREEREQLTDFIITQYSVIDHASAARFFDGYEQMLTALHADTGSEHDLNEVFVGKSDACYARMVNALLRKTGWKDIHDLFLLTPEERLAWLPFLLQETGCEPAQAAKFLRLVLKRDKGPSNGRN